MSLLQDLINKISQVYTRLNAIEQNAKTNQELPVQDPLNVDSLVRVTRDGTSEILSIKDIINRAILDSQQYLNRFIAIRGFSLSDNTLTINAGWRWMLNATNYSNIDAQYLFIPWAAPGKIRIDVIVASFGFFYVIPGVETLEADGNPIAPPVPINALQATFVIVTESTISQPIEPPVTGSWFHQTFVYGASKKFALDFEATNVLYVAKNGQTLNGRAPGFVQYKINNDGRELEILDGIPDNSVITICYSHILDDTHSYSKAEVDALFSSTVNSNDFGTNELLSAYINSTYGATSISYFNRDSYAMAGVASAYSPKGIQFLSNATTGAVSGIRDASGSTPMHTGVKCSWYCKFKIKEIVAGSVTTVGFSPGSGAFPIGFGTTATCIVFGHDASGGHWKIAYYNGSVTNTIDLGANFPVSTNTMKVHFMTIPGTGIRYEVWDITLNRYISGILAVPGLVTYGSEHLCRLTMAQTTPVTAVFFRTHLINYGI